jgi:invasion protein IalB
MNGFKKYSIALLAVVLAGTLATASFAADVKPAPTPAVQAPAAPAPAKADAAKQPANEVVETGWAQRCPQPPKADDKSAPAPKADKKQCEIFQRINMKETSARVAEFAVGFPQEKTFEKGAARGVVILPLGILLEEGVQMKIDSGKPLLFKTRFCANAGCFSFVKLNKDVLDDMRKAKFVNFLFKTSAGQNVSMIMSMKGFDDQMKGIQ